MSKKIETYHLHSKTPLFTQRQMMRELCADLLADTPVVFAWYAKFYRDGTFTGMTTHPEVYHYIFQKQMGIAANINEPGLIAPEFSYLIPDQGVNSRILAHARDQFGLAKFFSLPICCISFLFCKARGAVFIVLKLIFNLSSL